MRKKFAEKDIMEELKSWLENRENLIILGKQRKLPLPPDSSVSCIPDIIASSKKGDKIYIIECKKGIKIKSHYCDKLGMPLGSYMLLH